MEMIQIDPPKNKKFNDIFLGLLAGNWKWSYTTKPCEKTKIKL
jgi:hypothetical protein